MSKSDQKDELLSATNSKIEAIKELIFGEDMQLYNQQFSEIKDVIESRRQEMESYMDSIKQELVTNLDNLNTDMNIRITELEKALESRLDKIDGAKVDRKALGKSLESLGKKLQG